MHRVGVPIPTLDPSVAGCPEGRNDHLTGRVASRRASAARRSQMARALLRHRTRASSSATQARCAATLLTYRQAVVVPTPNPAASSANVSPFRR
jgi:hypothetical protein